MSLRILNGEANSNDTQSSNLPSPAEVEDHEQIVSRGSFIIIAMLVMSLLGMHWMKRYKISWLQLPSIATLIGLLTGFLLWKLGKTGELQDTLALNQDIFFLVFLPPIIFESGFSMSGLKSTFFFRNLATILSFAILCTLLSIVFIGTSLSFSHKLGIIDYFSWKESFVFGALISSTDPVAVLSTFKQIGISLSLNAIVFGESILNDAISIVFYKSIIQVDGGVANFFFNFLAAFFFSLCIGSFLAIVAAFMYKHLDFHLQENHQVEVALLLIFPWASYLLAESLGLSGVVSILFCGICMGKYCYENLSSRAKVLCKTIFAAVSFLLETLVFLYLGIAVFCFNLHLKSPGLLIWIGVIVSLGRIVSVYLTSRFVNLFRQNKLKNNEIIILIMSGLRGSVAFALAIKANKDFSNGAGEVILTASLFYSLFTILVIGTLLTPVIRYLSNEDECARLSGTGEAAEEGRLAIVQLDFTSRPPMSKKNHVNDYSASLSTHHPFSASDSHQPLLDRINDDSHTEAVSHMASGCILSSSESGSDSEVSGTKMRRALRSTKQSNDVGSCRVSTELACVHGSYNKEECEFCEQENAELNDMDELSKLYKEGRTFGLFKEYLLLFHHRFLRPFLITSPVNSPSPSNAPSPRPTFSVSPPTAITFTRLSPAEKAKKQFYAEPVHYESPTPILS